MGKRTTSRRIAMQVLYEADLGGAEIIPALQNIFEEEQPRPDTQAFTEKLVKGAWENREKIDFIIKKYLKGWKLDRIGGVDRSILRLALFELKYSDTPRAVVIDEALELAKKYSTDEASKFINGVLGAYVKDNK